VPPNDSSHMPIRFSVNGREVTVRAHPMARLLDVLRTELTLTGTKEGCGEGECGACSVFIDGRMVNSCLVPIIQLQGRSIETVEGLADQPGLRPLHDAFIECGGAQCGICTPGMIVAAADLLRRRARSDAPAGATDPEIREALAGNLCRCTGYTRIVDSVLQACRRVEQEAGR
jgi:aerobic carbon-monoxide dehydrogenase small subunit